MSQGNRLTWLHAYDLAAGLKARLEFCCEKIEIVGSLRRLAPDCGDIELLVLPVLQESLLEGVPGVSTLDLVVNELVEKGELIRANKGAVAKKFYLPQLKAQGINFPVEICVSTPDRWAIEVAIKTGPAKFSEKLVTRRCEGGFLPSDCCIQEGWQVWQDDKRLFFPDETAFIEFCLGEWVPPVQRITLVSPQKMRPPLTLAEIDPEKALCFTGHRPKNLLRYPDFESKAKIILKTVVERAYRQGYRFFISGGALGIDQWAAQVVVDMRSLDEYKDLRLIIARPFPDQAAEWATAQQAYFEWLCAQADLVVDVNPDPYHPSKMHSRNRWMVDHSKSAVGIYDDRPTGGTANCVKYAMSKIPILIIDPAAMVTQPAGNIEAHWRFPASGDSEIGRRVAVRV